jgi:signal transduction histidine kinase
MSATLDSSISSLARSPPAFANARAYSAEKKRAEALAEIDRAKTAFFSNVSHEFRTPLTLMLGPLQDLLARSQTHLSPTAKEQLDLVSRNGDRLLRLVNTLLDFSRLEAGRVQAVYQATDLASFTSELASVFRSATDKAGLRLVVDCSDLGEPVYVDRDMWEKIVLNLISNAFKFTFEGEIAVSVHRVGNMAELRVRDTGVGIPAEAIPKLFERFNRVPNMPSRTHEGSGIGLALVHELVKLHGGSVSTESTRGTRLHVRRQHSLWTRSPRVRPNGWLS